MVFVKILVLIAAVILAVFIVRYRLQVVQMFGKNSYAERYLGPGGTFTLWILIALLLVVLALIWLVGIPGL